MTLTQRAEAAERELREMAQVWREDIICRYPVTVEGIADLIVDLRAALVAAEKDAERLEWVMRNVSGAEWRRFGIYSANCDRVFLDDAIAAQKKP